MSEVEDGMGFAGLVPSAQKLREERLKKNRCMQCGAEHDSATGFGNESAPMPDAIAICIACGHVQVYDENLRFREMTVDEAIDVKNDIKVQLALYAIKKIHGR